MMGVFGAAFPFFSSSSLSQHSQVAVSGTYPAYFFFLEGKALVITDFRIIKAESEVPARGPAAKPRPAGEMLNLKLSR